MVSDGSLRDNKSLQIYRTLLSILADLNNAVVWMVSIRPVISKSSCPCTNPLMTVPRTPITIGIIVTHMFYSFFISLARWRYLFLFSHDFISLCGLPRQQSPQYCSIIIIIYSLEFFTSALADGFSLELSDSKSLQVSRTRLRILAVLSNAIVWIVSTRLPTPKSSRPFSNPLVIVPKESITTGTIITFMFYSFFNSLARPRYLSFSHSFKFILWSAGTAKSTILQMLFFIDYYKVWTSGWDQVIRLYVIYLSIYLSMRFIFQNSLSCSSQPPSTNFAVLVFFGKKKNVINSRFDVIV